MSLRDTTRWQWSVGLLAACLIAVAIGSTRMFDESYVAFGDPPRYLMDGVYFRDLAVDHPFSSLSEFLDYTRLYYARYPALSLGHHPLLLPLAEAPVFAVFGVSVAAARLVPLLSLILAVSFLYMTVAELYSVPAAFLAGALLATSPTIATLSRSVMSEMPTIALMMASAYFLLRFCATQRRSMLMAFVVAAVLSLYSKQLAILLAPALAATAATTLGIRRLLKRDILWAVGAIILLTLPLVPLSLALSPTNVRGAADALRLESAQSLLTLLRLALDEQLAWPIVVLAAFGAARAIALRDRRAVLFIVWVIGVLPALYLFRGVIGQGPRYTVYWVPALCALAVSVVDRWTSRLVVPAVLVLLFYGLSLQTIAASRVNLVGVGGYEEAARFVVNNNPGPTVLFSGDIDSGFFAFFVRKHDVERRIVVLRSDKIFTTSYLTRPAWEDRIDRPDEIDPLLRQFGVRYVVIEDRPSRSNVLEWLRQELHSARFVERRRIPIVTSFEQLRGTDLVVYEFVGATVPDGDVMLSLDLPIAGQSFRVSLSDLINRKYLR